MGTRLAKIDLCFIYSKNLKFYRKGLQQRSYLLFKGQVYKNISSIMIKTSRLHHWVYIGNFIAKFENVFLCWNWFWKPPSRITFQNLRSFREKYLWWSFVIIKTLTLRFIVNFLVSETYDFIKLYHDLWRFIADLDDVGLFSTIFQFMIYRISFIANTFTTIVNKKSWFLFIKRLIRYMKTRWIILYIAMIYLVTIGIKWLWVFKN